MAEIVSLNRYRKARQRARAASEALRNRVRHGRTKAEKHCGEADRNRQAKLHDGRSLERTDPTPDTD